MSHSPERSVAVIALAVLGALASCQERSGLAAESKDRTLKAPADAAVTRQNDAASERGKQERVTAQTTRSAPFVFEDGSGRQEFRYAKMGRNSIEFEFSRTRGSACAWRVTGTASAVGPEEIEGEDGLPIFFDQYRIDPGQAKCEILIGLEEKTRARAQVRIGKKCGDSCKLDDKRALMAQKSVER